MNHINNHHDNPLDGWSDEQMWKKIDRALTAKKRRKYLMVPFILLLFSGLSVYLLLMNPTDMKTVDSTSLQKTETGESVALRKPMKKESYSDSKIKIQNKNKLPVTILSKTTNLLLIEQNFKTDKSKLNNEPKSLALIELTEQRQTGSNDQNEIFSKFNINKDTESGILTKPNMNRLTKTHIDFSTIPSKTNCLDKSNQNFEYLELPFNYFVQILNKNFVKPKYTIQFSNGFGYGKRSNKLNTSIEWELQKNSNEQYLYTTSHELSISRFSSKGFFYSLGFDYHRIISNVTGKNVVIEKQPVLSDSARVQTINEHKYYYPGSLTRTITVTDHYNVYNTYSSLYFPIKLGIRFGDNKNMCYLDLGTQIMLYKHLKGYTTDSDSRIKLIQNAISNTKTKDFYLSDIIGSFQYDRKIRESFSLSVGLHGQIPIKPMITQIDNLGNKFESYYSNYFFKIGLKWNIK